MDQVVIKKADIPKLADGGRFSAPVRAPARAGGQACYELAESPSEIAFDFANVRVPLKEAFLPQTEVLCTFDYDQVTEVPLPTQKTLVFGCRPCDARAMSQLDAVFSPKNKGFADPYFLQRRENAVVIVWPAPPCPTCFCTAMGAGRPGRRAPICWPTSCRAERAALRPGRLTRSCWRP
jgi:hypothetical protein